MSRRILLTRVDGHKVSIGVEHVETVAPAKIEVESDVPGAYPEEVDHFYETMCVTRTHYFLNCTEIALASGTTYHVREPADEVAELVWPVAWETCHCAPGGVLDDDLDAPHGYAPIGPWEPVAPVVLPEHTSTLASGRQWTFEPTLVVVHRRPLRRVGGDK